MASGSFDLTTYYAKRIIGDANANTAATALLQTGTGVTTDTWIISRTNRSTDYGIFYNYDATNGDTIEFIGGNPTSTTTAWIKLDDGSASFSGNTLIGGTLEVTGATSLSGLSISGNATIGGTLGVTGATSLSSLTTSGNTAVQGTLTVTSATILNNTLSVSGNATFNDIYLNSDKDIYMNYNNTNYLVLLNDNNGNIGLQAATGTLKIGYLNTSTIALYSSNTSTQTEFFEINSNGAYALTRFGVNGQNTSYTLYVNGTANITGNTTIGGTLEVTSATSLSSLSTSGNTTIGGTLGVTGATSLSSLSTSGSATIGTTLGVTGAATLSSTLDVTDATTLNSTLDVSGATTISNDVYIAQITDVSSTNKAGSLIIGSKNSKNLAFDSDEIMARDGDASNGYTSNLNLNIDASSDTDHLATVTIGNDSDSNAYVNIRYVTAIDNSTSTGLTGALQVAGGAGFAKDIIIKGWARSIGETGWYNQTYGGGWYMPETDTTNHTGAYVKMCGNKQLLISSNHTTSSDNLSSQLIVSSISYSSALATTSGQAVGIELWRGSNASWQIINDGGNLHFKNNYTTSKQSTYTQDSVTIAYNTGNTTIAGTLTTKDNIIIQTEGATADNVYAGISLRVKDTTTNQNQTSSYIRAYNKHLTNNDGMNLLIQSGAAIIIGAGESAGNYYSEKYTASSTWGPESLYLLADTSIFLYAGANTITNRAGIAIGSTGNILPYKNDAANNNAQNLGASDNKWANVYATTFTGDLSGNSATATALTTNAGDANTPVYFTGGKPSACNAKLGAKEANSYWGMCSGANSDTVYIRTTTKGLLPYESGGSGSGHGNIGTSSWRFSAAYIDTVTTNKTYGAVWNDIAECRKATITEPGRVVVENKFGAMELASQRLQPTGRIISDTYGYCMGDPSINDVPIAIAGRVLVYPYRDPSKYSLGDCVCAAPNGTVDIMTRKEIQKYPDRIIGIVSEIPNYEVWSGGAQNGNDDIQVKDRIWIYIR